MRLQLTLSAQDLPSSKKLLPLPRTGPAPGVFAVVTLMEDDNATNQNRHPRLLGQTEVLTQNTTDPDWTKLLYIDDWQFGQAQTLVIVTLYTGRQSSLGSVVFSVSAVVAAPGGRLAKQIAGGDHEGTVVLQIEEAPSVDQGLLRFQLRGWQLANLDAGLGLLNKSDPFFELQRWHAQARVWDVVFRSATIDNNLQPLWDEGFVPVHALVGSSTTTSQSSSFRLAVYDEDANCKRAIIGYTLLTIADMMRVVHPSAALPRFQPSDDDSQQKALVLKHGETARGKVFVVAVEVAGATVPADVVQRNQHEEEEVVVEPDITVETTTADIVVENEIDLEEEAVSPTFVSYVRGGCELRVTVAIDATASNGDPRQATSLHSFDSIATARSSSDSLQPRNAYEEALLDLCPVLAQFDSDQKYPVYGFGAKQPKGEVSHCFPLGGSSVVDGVEGILTAYRTAFRSGLVMSSPRDFSAVIAQATKDAQEEMSKGQNYSILLIFTNGAPADIPKTIEALRDASQAPLSIVLVGVGSGDFVGLQSLLQQNVNPRITFVQHKAQTNPGKLAQSALSSIPDHLVSYFVSHEIMPQPAAEVDEIVVAQYQPQDTDIVVPLHIDSHTGQATLVHNDDTSGGGTAPATAAASPTSGRPKWGEYMAMGMKQFREGQKLLRKNRRMVGQVKRMARKYIKF